MKGKSFQKTTQKNISYVDLKASTSGFHFALSLDVVLHSIQVRIFAFSSAIHVLLHFCVGRPFFRFPCGFHTLATPISYMALTFHCPIFTQNIGKNSFIGG